MSRGRWGLNPDRAYKGKGQNNFDASVVDASWFEWRTNAALLGSTPDAFELRPPAWFRREELGYSFEHGPSISWFLLNLERINRAAIKQLGRDAPIKVSYPRAFVDPRKMTTGPRNRRKAQLPHGGGDACGAPMSQFKTRAA